MMLSRGAQNMIQDWLAHTDPINEDERKFLIEQLRFVDPEFGSLFLDALTWAPASCAWAIKRLAASLDQPVMISSAQARELYERLLHGSDLKSWVFYQGLTAVHL